MTIHSEGMEDATLDVTRTKQVFDSRNVIANLEAIEEQHDLQGEEPDEVLARLIAEDADEANEYGNLLQFARAAQDVHAPDWEYGARIVPEEAFDAEYAEEEADEYGAFEEIPATRWPFQHIDWDAAADALKEDYAEFEVFGRTFYIR